MIEISGVDHIATAVREPAPVLPVLQALLGFEPYARIGADGTHGFNGVRFRVPGRSAIDWELLWPVDTASPLSAFVDGPQGPGLHHVSFRVASVRAAIAQARALGIEPFGMPTAWEQDDAPLAECFIAPRDAHGLLLHLAARVPVTGIDTIDAIPAVAPDVPPSAASSTTLGIIAVDHVSHACADRTELRAWYERVLGMEYARSTGGPQDPRPFSTDAFSVPAGQLEWEIIEPVGDDSFVQRHLDRRGPSCHHVTFQVGDFDRALAACAAHGIEPFGHADGGTGDTRWREAFLHPRETGGVLMQFYWEASPGAWL